jgi:hypothetical protein
MSQLKVSELWLNGIETRIPKIKLQNRMSIPSGEGGSARAYFGLGRF